VRVPVGLVALEFPLAGITGLCSGYEHGCEKWLTESTEVNYAQKPVKSLFSSKMVTVELQGDSGETIRRHLGVEGAVE